MRKLVLLGVAVGVFAFALAFATPAKANLGEWIFSPADTADVDVFADIKKLKIKFVGELILKLKLVHLDADLELTAEKFAESEAVLTQVNKESSACENCAEKTDRLINSVLSNTGIVNINQSTGNMNNQGIVLSVAIDAQDPPDPEPPGSPDRDGFAESQAMVGQVNKDNLNRAINILFRYDRINNSINQNTGIVNVNQAAGSMNNQATAISIAVSLSNGVALSEADLGQTNVRNTSVEFNNFVLGDRVTRHDKQATILSSINANSGIVSVSQATGNMANQGNVLSLAAAVNALPAPGILGF
jgi:hypothetical protein